MNIITIPSEATLKIRRSTFIGYVAPCADYDEMKTILQERSLLHSRATHNCWAYITGFAGENAHFSDAGEPSGSAGRPMFNVLRSHDLTNIVSIVTRYYGGVKLGVRGLIDAYGESVEAAVAGSSLSELVREWEFDISMAYSLLDTFNHVSGTMGCTEVSSEYNEAVHLRVKVKESFKDDFLSYLQTLRDSQGIVFEELGESR